MVKKSANNAGEPRFDSWVGKICWRRDRLPTPVFLGFLWDNMVVLGFSSSSASKESTCNSGDPHSIPGSGRFAGEEISYPLQCSWASLVAQLVKNSPAMQETWVRSLGWENPMEKGPAHPLQFSGLENPMDCTVHEVTKSQS